MDSLKFKLGQAHYSFLMVMLGENLNERSVLVSSVFDAELAPRASVVEFEPVSCKKKPFLSFFFLVYVWGQEGSFGFFPPAPGVAGSFYFWTVKIKT